jgi:hypothetical protein
MKRGLVIAWVMVGCGGTPAPAPQTIGHQVATPAAATCTDVGVILRGRVDTGEDAGRAREAAIANACETDKWSPAVVECVAGNKKPDTCLARLDEKQRAAYDEKLQAWSTQYGGSDYGGDTDDPPPPQPDVTCADAVAPSDLGPPLPKLGDADAKLDRKLRAHVLEQLCDDDAWDEEVVSCLGPDSSMDRGTCLLKLPSASQDHVTAKLGEIDALVGKLDAARKKKPDCKKAVATHYADSQWKGKLAHIKGKDRTKMIAQSRDRMAKACTAEKWDDTTRACVVVGGGGDCFDESATGKRWGFPAQGVVVAVGIPECDAWGAEVAKLMTCDKLPQSSRDAIKQAYEQATGMWAAAADDERASIATACKSVTDAVIQARASVGCP